MFKNRELKVDIALISVINNELAVLLLKRPYEPFKEHWALPGGFIPENMSADEAAHFQLNKKTGLSNVFLEQLSLFSNPKRDPSGVIASMAYLSLVDSNKMKAIKTDDSLEVKWFKLSDIPKNIAFDHKDIIKKAQERIINQMRYTKIGFELAGKEFTIKQLVNVFESVTSKKLDLSNVRKKMLKLDLLRPTDKVIIEGAGRPSPVFKLNMKTYNKLDKTESFFN